MRGGGAVLAGGLALVVFVGVAAAGSPLVSAGLDQNVVQGDPVYLDAGGTHVPDGELAGLEWSIEAPNGSTVEPDCIDCEVTWFRANQTGQYNVTLTARSGSGQERSDTLYVEVESWSAAGATGGNDTTPAVNDTTANVANTGSGDTLDDCFIANEGDAGTSMDHGICSETGDVVGTNVDDSGQNIESYVVERTGYLLHRYDDIEYTVDGNYRIPEDAIHYQSVDIWEAHQENEMSGSLGQEGRTTLSDSDGQGSDTCDPRIPTYYC